MMNTNERRSLLSILRSQEITCQEEADTLAELEREEYLYSLHAERDGLMVAYEKASWRSDRAMEALKNLVAWADDVRVYVLKPQEHSDLLTRYEFIKSDMAGLK